MHPISRTFYTRENIVLIAKDLLGKFLVTSIGGELASGMIVETEAYEGVTDRASHAYGNRFTGRTKIMYEEGGTAYIYLCYGVHSLFNIVTNKKGVPHAILIRGVIPEDGKDTMLARTGKVAIHKGFGIGPGKVSKILGIHYSMTGLDLTFNNPRRGENAIWLEDRGVKIPQEGILVSPRIGVEYSGPDAVLPYRFRLG